MKKSLIIGITTLAITGSALLGSSIYAASGTTTTSPSTQKEHRQGGGENMVASLSGKVSPEALTALQTLVTKHKATMDSVMSSTTKPTEAEMEAQHATFKAEMDALMVKYPELKTTLEKNRPPLKGGKMGVPNKEVDALIATLPTAAQTELKSIRDSYQVKQEALRTEEKSKIDAVLAQYPTVKAKLDALEKNRPNDNGQGRGLRGMMGGSESTQKQ